MSRVVPSQAVEIIDRVLPYLVSDEASGNNAQLSGGYADRVTVVYSAVEQIDDELITLVSDDLIAFKSSLSVLKYALDAWS